VLTLHLLGDDFELRKLSSYFSIILRFAVELRDSQAEMRMLSWEI
jgi:hypothetical protein